MGILNRGLQPWLPAALTALLVAACVERDYDNPFLAGDSGLEESWRQDRDGNGIADSVEFHARGCKRTPADCLRIAREAAQAKAQQGLPKGPSDTVKASPDAGSPPKDTVKTPSSQDTAKVPPQDSVPPKDTLEVPPKDTVKSIPTDTVKAPPQDTVKAPPRDTVKPPPRDTLSVIPPKDTVIAVLPKDTVLVPIPTVIPVTGIQAAETYLPLGAAKVTPAVAVVPRNAAEQGFTLTSLDESIVRVAGTDLVPVKPGKAIIRARSLEGGFTTEFPATVLVPGTDTHGEKDTVRVVSVSSPDLTLRVGARVVPAIAFEPPAADNRGYVLRSDKPGTARVDGREIIAVRKGSAEITVTSLDGGKTHVFKVKVEAPGMGEDEEEDGD